MDIFGNESAIIDRARQIIKANNLSSSDLIAEYESLLNSYQNLLNDTLKMTRISDSTQRKLKKVQDKLEEQNLKINEQNSTLLDLNSTKDKFLSIISHDLRNPISAVILLTNLLSQNIDNLDNSEIKNVLNNVEKSTKTLHDLFENLLKWAKSQTGTLEFAIGEIEVNVLVTRIFSLLETAANQKEIKLISKLKDPIRISADENMLETVIRNLISNAIKFTNAGGHITLECKERKKFWLFTISDDGIGIANDMIAKLFKIGEEVKTKGTAKEYGSGLGLILCREFVERHHGKIWVESKIGVGSKFFFTIPKINLQ